MADTDEREAAIASTEQSCPRCGAPRAPDQEYCVECGLRLPTLSGVIPALRRRWIRRFGWYPGDWVWTSVVTFPIAAAGAALAIAFAGGNASGGGPTFVVITNSTSSTTTTASTTTVQTTTATEPTTTTATKTTATTRPATTKATTTAATTTTAKPPAAPANGRTAWPPAHSGWTLVLISYPVTGGRSAALATARGAANSGLPKVGVLTSSGFGSLHPGYYVVFSGIYDTQSQADSALTLARARGFKGAYSRQITP